jgi:hypothetical protein
MSLFDTYEFDRKRGGTSYLGLELLSQVVADLSVAASLKPPDICASVMQGLWIIILLVLLALDARGPRNSFYQ